MQVAVLEGHNASLTTSLKDDMEQKIDFQPWKEHVVAQRRKIHHLQMCVEEGRCKLLEIDSILEEILDTTSYFLDKYQDILEIPTRRIVWVETNEEPPIELPVKDWYILKQDYDLLDFAINIAEEFKKTIKKKTGACAEYCRRVLVTYNRCQVSAEKKIGYDTRT